jgi:hypothetical protein
MSTLRLRVSASAAAAVVLVAALLPIQVRADVTCGRCGCVMHTDKAPPKCWECGRPLFTPAPNPGPDSDLPPDGDFGPMSSGFELGVRFVATPRGIRVISVKPDSAADGVLFVNDIIAAAAYRDDNGRKRQLPTRTSAEMETVKHLAGQSKTALMIRRPSGQVRYAFVVFQPIGGAGTPVEAAVDGRSRSFTSSIEIDDTGEAKELFGGLQEPAVVPQGGGGGGNGGRGDGAEDFFNDR